MQVSPAQREFVLRMLASSSFNKVLSGVRQCLELLVRSRKLELNHPDLDDELRDPTPLEVRC